MEARTKLFLFQHSSHSLLLSPGFFALKISNDFVNPHTTMVKYDKIILHLFSYTEDSLHLKIVNDNFFLSDRCDMPLGLEDGRVPDPLIRASSFYNYYCGPFNARLNRRRYGRQGGAWCAKRRDRRQWLQVDFGALSTVSGVATQGRQNSAQWVTSYYISYSRNGYKFAPYREGRRTRVRALACLFYLFYLFATLQSTISRKKKWRGDLTQCAYLMFNAQSIIPRFTLEKFSIVYTAIVLLLTCSVQSACRRFFSLCFIEDVFGQALCDNVV